MNLEQNKNTARADMKEKLVLAALGQLEANGVHGVRARDLAAEAGCAVGTIYNLVGDLDDLILLASARTLEEFKEFAIGRYNEAVAAGASERDLLTALSGAYIDYAKAHMKRWQANFEISFDEDSHYFRTYVAGQHQLISIIVSVLRKISPQSDDRDLFAIARALWASVHGIAMLAMSNRANVLPREKILEQCHRIIDPVISSLAGPPEEKAA